MRGSFIYNIAEEKKVVYMDDLKKYVTKNSKDKAIIVITGVIFAILGIVSIVGKKSLVIGIAFIVLGVFAIYGGLTTKQNEEKDFNNLKAKGELEAVIEDFKVTKSFLDDDIRFGEKYIYRKKDSRILKYEEIKDVEYVGSLSTTSEATTTVYKLYVTLTSGKSEPLYGEKGDHQEEANEMIQIILAHNPNAQEK